MYNIGVSIALSERSLLGDIFNRILRHGDPSLMAGVYYHNPCYACSWTGRLNLRLFTIAFPAHTLSIQLTIST